MIYVHTASVPCEIAVLQQKCDPRTARPLESNPEVVLGGDIAIVQFIPKEPVSWKHIESVPP